MPAVLNTILIYARSSSKTAAFYRTFFDFHTTGEMVEGLIELTSDSSGSIILIHQAAKSVKLGQAGVKLMFSVEDVEAHKARCAQDGLVFGVTHQAYGYVFSNAKDPDGNSVGISSRAFRATSAE